MWGEIQLHPYVGGALGGAVGGTLPSKAPPTQGEGGLGGGVGERLSLHKPTRSWPSGAMVPAKPIMEGS